MAEPAPRNFVAELEAAVTAAPDAPGARASLYFGYMHAKAFDKALAACKADKSWRTFETTASGHDVMIDAPEWLADILLQVS